MPAVESSHLPSPKRVTSACLDGAEQLLVDEPPTRQRALDQFFGDRSDAVVRGQRDQRVAQPDELVDALQQLTDHAIGADGDVVNLR